MEKNKSLITEINSDLDNLITLVLDENPSIMGINIGTHEGKLLANKFRNDIDINLKEERITSASVSLLSLSSVIMDHTLNEDLIYNIIEGKDVVVISMLMKNISIVAYLNRLSAGLKGLDSHIKTLKHFGFRISAFVETSQLLQEEIFVSIKRAIPNCKILLIVTREGLPIKSDSSFFEQLMSGRISALYQISGILLTEGKMEFSIITGNKQSIIIHELPMDRILCISVPDTDEKKLGSYIITLRSIIEQQSKKSNKT